MPGAPEILLSPAEALAAWPGDVPLAAIWSGSGAGVAHSRWTILAAPISTSVHGSLPEFLGRERTAVARGTVPFVGGHIFALSYDLGFDLEPATVRHAERRAKDDRRWPRVIAARCDDALVYDSFERRWHGVGDWERLAAGVVRGGMREGKAFECSMLRSATGRARFLEQARRVLEHIRSGDAYQINLAHRLSGEFHGSARGAFAALMNAARPWYGGYLECDEGSSRRAVLSASPELLLSLDGATREMLTRPMKGTRSGAGSAAELRESAKDRAELAMIVDLMRNDLGRVSAAGSVRVLAARDVELHADAAPLWQATATVSGRLREGLALADVVRAVFPGGSVTGAPKIRAMRIIDELEPVARGPYCGSVGFVSDCGNAAFNVAIRTALVTGKGVPGTLDGIAEGTLDYSVGAGIVADSVPELEWQETLDKAGVVRALGAIEE